MGTISWEVVVHHFQGYQVAVMASQLLPMWPREILEGDSKS